MPAAEPDKELVAAPNRMRIDRLGVDAAIVPVGLEPDGAMGIPARAADVGWYAPGTVPGTAGNAILAGHYDWYGAIGVFHRLTDLVPGDRIVIVNAAGRGTEFVVTRTHWFAADDSPATVFASTETPTITLVTCGGALDPVTGTYDKRFVVTATAI